MLICSHAITCSIRRCNINANLFQFNSVFNKINLCSCQVHFAIIFVTAYFINPKFRSFKRCSVCHVYMKKKTTQQLFCFWFNTKLISSFSTKPYQKNLPFVATYFTRRVIHRHKIYLFNLKQLVNCVSNRRWVFWPDKHTFLIRYESLSRCLNNTFVSVLLQNVLEIVFAPRLPIFPKQTYFVHSPSKQGASCIALRTKFGPSQTLLGKKYQLSIFEQLCTMTHHNIQ